MTNKECRGIALRLMLEQLENTNYSLEREEFTSLNQSEVDAISQEVYKVSQQFKKRYSME